MFDRFRNLPQIWRTVRLALRLLRDPRVPTAAKLLFGATVLYMLSPIDIVPDWLPVLGQADDLVVLMAGLNLFLRACPKWLVEEHEDRLGASREDRQPATTGGPYSSTIDGSYQRVR
jgi:uncharacterized membrane protein YkvA (DUF1232 family)